MCQCFVPYFGSCTLVVSVKGQHYGKLFWGKWYMGTLCIVCNFSVNLKLFQNKESINKQFVIINCSKWLNYSGCGYTLYCVGLAMKIIRWNLGNLPVPWGFILKFKCIQMNNPNLQFWTVFTFRCNTYDFGNVITFILNKVLWRFKWQN